jgi:peroxiredoxin
MGQLTDELAALRAERLAATPTELSEVSREAVKMLRPHGWGADVIRPGTKAPEFSLPDQNGETVHLSGLLNAGHVILTFYRGSWCPFCNLELRAFQRSLPRIRELGANLVAVSPELPDRSLTLVERHALEFPVLSDRENVVAKKYGIVFRLGGEHLRLLKERGQDLMQINGKEGAAELPVPATFIINKSGVVAVTCVDPDHTYRVDPDDLIEYLESL